MTSYLLNGNAARIYRQTPLKRIGNCCHVPNFQTIQDVMQTNLILDDQLFQEAACYAHTDNPGELIQLALREFIRSHRLAQAAAVSARSIPSCLPSLKKFRASLPAGKTSAPQLVSQMRDEDDARI
jgi:hypothetical protein